MIIEIGGRQWKRYQQGEREKHQLTKSCFSTKIKTGNWRVFFKKMD